MQVLSELGVTGAPVLEATRLRRGFGGLVAVDGCSFGVRQPITGIIGPNGAGKSTLVSLVAGNLQPDSGRILLNSQDITNLPPDRRCRLGVVRTFQISRQFHTLSVLENLLVAAPGSDDTLLGALFRRRHMRARDKAAADQALELLDDVGLYAARDDYAGNLSGGQMRLLEIARAVMSRPSVLLLDEPTAGVNPVLVNRVEANLERLADGGTKILLVEHNLKVVERLCTEVIVMARGSVLAVGTMADHRKNDEVLRAYLGTGEAT